MSPNLKPLKCCTNIPSVEMYTKCTAGGGRFRSLGSVDVETSQLYSGNTSLLLIDYGYFVLLAPLKCFDVRGAFALI